jgi:enolase-phosphatase E1
MIKAIVTDIEGTTTSISFVYDVLFPYARAQLADFVRCHAEDVQVAPCLNDVRRVVGEELDLEGVIAQLEQWMAEDKKLTPLKALQGLVWETGYQKGDFTGHVYDDAHKQLLAWHAQGIALYVYSSGSVKAQKLLFAHSCFGDLTPLFSGYFDTTIGAKDEPASYAHIVVQSKLPADATLFLSDVEKELAAAAGAGMQTYWLVRGADPSNTAAFRQVRDFSEVLLE